MSKSIGQALRDRREAAGLSQVDLARRINTNPQVINRIEQGARSDPRWSTIVRIAQALDYSLDVLAADTGLVIVAPAERSLHDELGIVIEQISDVKRRLSDIRTRPS